MYPGIRVGLAASHTPESIKRINVCVQKASLKSFTGTPVYCLGKAHTLKPYGFTAKLRRAQWTSGPDAAESGGRVQSDLHLFRKRVGQMCSGVPAQRVCSCIRYFSGSHSFCSVLFICHARGVRRPQFLSAYVDIYGSMRPICALWRSSRRGHGSGCIRWLRGSALLYFFDLRACLRGADPRGSYSTPPKDTFCPFRFCFSASITF